MNDEYENIIPSLDEVEAETNLVVSEEQLQKENEEVTARIVASSITLTEEQQESVDLIKRWYHSCREQNIGGEFKLGGYAGTGKTTVIRTIRDTLSKDCCIKVSAFTGKAVNVLQRKGISAQTLHSLMYNCERTDKGVLIWHKKASLPEVDLIIVDEASMISVELYRDLVSFGLPILFVGDPGQLEPVGDNPNLMLKPDFVLTHIHRQASESPIISLAGAIRTGGKFFPIGEHFSPDGASSVVIQQKGKLNASDYDQIICATNKTRKTVNDGIRIRLDLVPKTITVGEKIIILKNNRDLGVFNGMILFVNEIESSDGTHWLCHCKDEIGNLYNNLPIWSCPFEDDNDLRREEVVPRVSIGHERVQAVWAAFGYCITCHKSQGSEWDRLLVLDETMYKTDMKRWRYTAITRAAKRLVYCL